MQNMGPIQGGSKLGQFGSQGSRGGNTEIRDGNIAVHTDDEMASILYRVSTTIWIVCHVQNGMKKYDAWGEQGTFGDRA